MYDQTDNILAEKILCTSLWRALLQICILTSFGPKQDSNAMKPLP